MVKIKPRLSSAKCESQVLGSTRFFLQDTASSISYIFHGAVIADNTSDLVTLIVRTFAPSRATVITLLSSVTFHSYTKGFSDKQL